MTHAIITFEGHNINDVVGAEFGRPEVMWERLADIL